MLNRTSITAMALLLAMSAPAQAGSSGLLINDDSVQFHKINDSSPLFDVEVRQAYNLMYSQEQPGNRDYLLSAEFEFPEQVQEFQYNQSITPKVDLMYVKFMDRFITAAALGASYRLAPSDTRSFDIVTEATLAPLLTTFGTSKYIWTFNTQLNYPITDKVAFNLGYRNITIKQMDNYKGGFERGLYFGLTTRFE